MKKIFGVLVAMGITGGAVQADDQKDHVDFLGTMSEEAWLNYPIISNFAQDPKYAGDDIVYFGVTVKGLFNKEVWHWTTCKDILSNNGDRARASMRDVLENKDKLQMFSPFNELTDFTVDLKSMRWGVDGAVNAAIAACTPKIS